MTHVPKQEASTHRLLDWTCIFQETNVPLSVDVPSGPEGLRATLDVANGPTAIAIPFTMFWLREPVVIETRQVN
jgi:hypothetical protein